jgi:hypothetical protein
MQLSIGALPAVGRKWPFEKSDAQTVLLAKVLIWWAHQGSNLGPAD